MRYCPKLDCPHRERVHAPAEFVDRLVRCSDCGTRLVESEEDAILGRAVAHDPYRAAAVVAEDAKAPAGADRRRPNDAAQGILFLLGGVGLGLMTFAFVSAGAKGVYVLACAPLFAAALGVVRARDRRR